MLLFTITQELNHPRTLSPGEQIQEVRCTHAVELLPSGKEKKMAAFVGKYMRVRIISFRR